MAISKIEALRKIYLQKICVNVLAAKEDTVNLADKSSASSSLIAKNLAGILGGAKCKYLPPGQETGRLFTSMTREFLREAFALLHHLRPGSWEFGVESAITSFDQYKHLLVLDKLIKENRILGISLGTDYLIKPDIVIYRYPLSDEQLAKETDDIPTEAKIANYTSLRAKNHEEPSPLLHASISCKWTIRSDRAQNTRTEALNLMRNRKGKTPQIAAVTAEPLPTRIASLALGTGDLDFVYHMALPELIEAVKISGNEDQMDMLINMVDGRRLRDISDLPFDLAV